MRSSKLKNTLRNLKLILDNDQTLANIVYNEQSDGLEKKGSVPWSSPSKYWRDADDAQLLMYLSDNYGEFSRSVYEVVVAKVADDRRYHPIKEYLSGLPEWDGIKRLDTLLVDYFGAVDNASSSVPPMRKAVIFVIRLVVDVSGLLKLLEQG